MPLPNFLCVGVEKAGTTSLYDLLLQHPDIGLSRHKETHFFNTNRELGLDWYKEKFSHVPDSTPAIGEITPAYFRFPEALAGIRHELGTDLKIIFMLREPTSRAFSHYVHNFANRLDPEDNIFKRYLKTSAYAPAVLEYQQVFGKHNVLCLVFEEDFRTNQQIAMDKISDFLALSRTTIKPVHSNPTWLPSYCYSPNQASQLKIENEFVDVPANSFVISTNRKKNTRICTGLSDEEIDILKQDIDGAIQKIDAVKRSVVFEQTAEPDIRQLERLINRNLDVWRDMKGDLVARVAPTPQFIPI